MAKKILSIVLALTLALSVFTVAASAAEIEATAESFENDYKTAANGDVIVLTEDVEIYGNKQTSKDITVDLAGHTITCTATGVAGLIASSKTGNLTITDSVGGGKIDSDFAALQAQTGATVVIDGGTIAGVRAVANFSSAGKVVVNDGVVNTGVENAIYLSSSYSSNKPSCTVNGGKINGDVYTEANCVLTVNGGEFTSDSYCIVGNGTKKNTAITINGGTFTATSETGAAIYHPQGGTLVINGGTFEGADALYIKSGTTLIKGGTFIGNGEAKAYSFYGNGFNTTGDAIVVDSCGYPNAQPPVVRILDGEFTSDEAASVKGYTYDSSADPIIYIYDGEFSDDAAETYASTTAVYNSTTGVSYETFGAAAQAAAEGDTLVLYKDVAVGAYTVVTDVTIDLSGCDITSAGNAPLDAYGTVTVKDSVGGGKIAGAQRGIWVNPGATLTVDTAEVDGVVVEGAATLKNAYIDGYVATLSGATVNVTSTDTVVTGDMTIDGSTLTINNGTFANVYVYNGTTATINNGKYELFYVYGNGSATINNGTFSGQVHFTTNSSAIIKKGTFNGPVYVEEDGDLTIDGGTFNDMIVTVGGWKDKNNAAANVARADYVSTLTINGGTFKDEAYNVAGNGDDVATTVTTINGGNFEVGKSNTNIFHPQRGTLTINGGTFKGGDCIYQKSGYVEINGGKLYAIGEYEDFEHTGNGYNQTGETIVIESCAYPGGAPSLRINGGEFYAVNNEMISYYYTEGNALESTEFVYGGTFEAEVPDEFIAKEIVPGLQITNGSALNIPYYGGIIITPDQGAVQVTVSNKDSVTGKTVKFANAEGGAKISKNGQAYAKSTGTVDITIGGKTYKATFVFPEIEAESIDELLVVTNAEVKVEDTTITLTPVDADKQITVSPTTTIGTPVTFGARTGAAKVSSGGILYASAAGTAKISIPDAGEYTVVFDYEEAPFVFSASLLKTTNADVTFDGETITLTAIDQAASASIVGRLKDGTEVAFSDRSGAKISSNGSLYANKDATAKLTVNGDTYNVVFDFVDPEPVALIDNLRTTNAEVVVNEGAKTITLTPNSDASPSIICKLKDGTPISFPKAGLNGAKISSNGSLYANKIATATATINGEDYTVIFDFDQIPVDELLKYTGAEVTVEGYTITLTAKAGATQINLYPTLKDGTAVSFTERQGCRKSSNGTLYAKKDATAKMTIGEDVYTVNFVF